MIMLKARDIHHQKVEIKILKEEGKYVAEMFWPDLDTSLKTNYYTVKADLKEEVKQILKGELN